MLKQGQSHSARDEETRSCKNPEEPESRTFLVGTMFVHDIETFSVLHDFWLTILSHPFDFSTTQCTFLSFVRISTFFYRRCVVFAVGGDPILRVQKYHDIETVVTLGHNGFG